MSRFFTCITFVMVIACLVLVGFGLLTTNWFEGPDGFHVGLASLCEEHVVIVKGHTITYCTSFTLNNFANETERGLTAALVICCFISLMAGALMSYSCCDHTNQPIRVLMMLQTLILIVTCVIYGFYRSQRLPLHCKIGSSYYAVLIAIPATFVTGLFSSCGLSYSHRGYERLA
ncbi:hypothetical protein SARC_09386 [Sphaeroforma arctica JP610]|uniref:Uncharacterized protein n=1 Tax=Sphaeroforma arctica JP610 TaxID=667725 RepID=A0A0L0FQ95_9EUKA|nr:hypothetical protein SARC_09386 [Sphaeroforma arctica JP610]KNC78168.1 hypothetical protein SARC_09386 [Sphaeroforma arctica JP610]|eukprot:XP_014152070.1 hypothetical protein SARC_09386 [Sphaeroforma arctica JP610]